ncbi:putative inactive disease susceptibility protein LOV1 [Primulina eburnea]|uniref:putative inactive disease susceptibility protein LOV1 n=1 Tax=Primulina eburnea TaxID=1245227 RepID=UPI003C6BF86F
MDVYIAIYAIQSLLNELLEEDLKNLTKLQGRIELIQTNLSKLMSILEIAESGQESDEGTRKWVGETRQAVYEIKFLLDSSRKEGSVFKRSHSFKDVGSRIKVVEDKITALESDSRVRHIEPRQLRIQKQRRTQLHQAVPDFVGLEKDLEALVKRLVGDDRVQDSQVVCLIGETGVGKTTLAKRIYYHEEIKNHFQAFAWIYVSQQWKLEDVLQWILFNLEPEKGKKPDRVFKAHELVNELFGVQQRKRCLIVLDGLWSNGFWDLLRPAFPTKQNRSKVLITTRSVEIAIHIDQTHVGCYLYEQRRLNEKESWELLKKKIGHRLNIAGEYGEYDDEDENDDGASSIQSFETCASLEEEDDSTDFPDISTPEDGIQDPKNQLEVERVGKEIVDRCAGLPQAIVLLGGILTTKSTITEWKMVHQNLDSYSRRGRSSQEKAGIRDVLSLSYHDLPYQLKPCFLYMGNFPDDYKISTRKLYFLWAAEGFLPSESTGGKNQESIADTGESYLGELAQRCMVKVVVDELTGRFKTCQLHDFTRELCLLKGKDENFLNRVPFSHETNSISSPSSSPTVASIRNAHRLSIAVEYDFNNCFPTAKLEHIRSALFFSRLSDRRNLQPTLELLCNESKLLKVLSLERFDFGRKLSKAIGDLVHLRYLSLRGSKFHELPHSIGNLKYLQTLDLRLPFSICLTIPNVIRNLNQLRHLYLPPSHTSAEKLQLSHLCKLKILKNFDTRVSDYRDIFKLTALQKLSAVIELETEKLQAVCIYLSLNSTRLRDSSLRVRHFFQSERELNLLKQLVGCGTLRKLDLIGTINKLPEHGLFTRSLVKLTLRNSMLKENPMATLEKLPNLHSLSLRKNAVETNELHCTSQGFPQLRILEIQGQRSVENWTVEEGAMPKLRSLKIDECVNLKMVPEGIRYIATLRELVIANMPDSFKNRVQVVQEEVGESSARTERNLSVKMFETSPDYTTQLEHRSPGSTSAVLRSFSPKILPKEWENA